MEKYIFKLDPLEVQMKEAYLQRLSSYYNKPMSLLEFQQLDEETRKLYSVIELHHRTVAENMKTSLVSNVFSGPDNNVEIVRHNRYSLPIFHKHDYVELVYVYNGSARHFIENQSFLMEDGDLCILPPQTSHAISVCDDDSILINIMVNQKFFDESFMKMMYRVPSLSQFFEGILYNHVTTPYILYPTGQDRWMHTLTLHLIAERHRSRQHLYNESVSLLVRQLFIYILRYYELSAIVAEPDNNQQNTHVVSLIAYITANQSDITLEQTADFFGYNKSYLSQLLRKYTGKTFSSFVNDLRMETAAQLICNSTKSLTEIAADIGCYDSSHFNRKFSKKYGMSPSEYQKKYKVDPL